MRKKPFEYECVVCKKKGMGPKNQKYCSRKCYLIWTGRKSQWKGIPAATVGKIQELRVAVDLLKKGFDVFEAVSPSCSCDILALKNNKMIRIEVRTAYQGMDKKFTYPLQRIRAEYLALALPDKIIYKPEII